MNGQMTERTQTILNKYCPKCGNLLTIGKRGRLYCLDCDKQKKKKRKKRPKWRT